MDSNPNYAACFTHADLVDEDGREIHFLDNVFIQPNRSQAEWLSHFFTKGNCICHPSMLMRRAVYRELGLYNGALRQLPDFDMWVRVAKRYPIHIIQTVLTSHRRFLASGENTSSPTLHNSLRGICEASYIMSSFFDGIYDDLFAQAFKKHFRNPNASTSQELTCEKFFLMLDKFPYSSDAFKLCAAHYFMKVYAEEGIAQTFKTIYGYTLMDFYNFTGQHDFSTALSKSADSKLKMLSLILFKGESRLYNFLKRCYFKLRKR